MTLCRRQRTGTAIFHCADTRAIACTGRPGSKGCRLAADEHAETRTAFSKPPSAVVCILKTPTVCSVLHLRLLFLASDFLFYPPPPLVYHVFFNALETLSLLLEEHGLIITWLRCMCSERAESKMLQRGPDKGSGLRLVELGPEPHRFSPFCCKSSIYYPADYYQTEKDSCKIRAGME